MARRKNTCTLLSWNVNGIRAIARKGFLDWLSREKPDVIGLQETKAHPEQLAEALRRPDGYESYFSSAQRKGYSGTAVFTRPTPLKTEHRIGEAAFDGEGRVVAVEFETFYLINTYIPNGKSDLSRVDFKLAYSGKILEMAQRFRASGKGVVLCGDFNTAHREIDLARPGDNEKNTGFLPRERAWIDTFLAAGYIDTFRACHPEQKDAYTWWDYKTRARSRNVGWRLDYFFVSEDLEKAVEDAFILGDVEGSDHCPVGLKLQI